MISFTALTRFTSLVSFVVGLPTTVGTYLQVMKTRREAKQAREGLVYSQNCLEFVLEDGTFVNLVPLESLHSLPKEGDMVLLPGAEGGALDYRAYRVNRIEHLYIAVDRVEGKQALQGQARLAKAVAHVDIVTKGV